MNDYGGTSHEVIYEMVKSGDPSQVGDWAENLTRISQQVGRRVMQLRETLAGLPTVWSDESGSGRLTIDLTALTDYLSVLSDALSGQSASYADLIGQAGGDLSAAQPPSVLPPPPAFDRADLEKERDHAEQIIADPFIEQLVVAQMEAQIAVVEAARLKAGQTATVLDDKYRTALARLTPPPQPPPIVLDAATAGGVDPGVGSGSVAEQGMSPGGTSSRSGVTRGGWSVYRYVPAGISPVAQAVSAGWSPGSTGSSATPAMTGSPGVTAAADSGVPVTGGVLTGVSSVLGASRSRVDPAALHGGIWGGTSVTGPTDLAGVGSAAHQLSGGGSLVAGAPALDDGFDPVTGSAVTAGPVRFGAGAGAGAGAGVEGSGWETAVGIGGISALAAGAAMLTRGGSAAVTAAGLSGGFGAGGFGAGGSGGAVGVGANGAGVLGAGAGGSGAGGSSPGAARGLLPGATGGASNSMVQGGQIGQSGRGMAGSAGGGTGRPVAPGSGIGGQHGYRVTWLVEDRDLYGAGPSVRPVIDSDDTGHDQSSL